MLTLEFNRKVYIRYASLHHVPKGGRAEDAYPGPKLGQPLLDVLFLKNRDTMMHSDKKLISGSGDINIFNIEVLDNAGS